MGGRTLMLLLCWFLILLFQVKNAIFLLLYKKNKFCLIQLDSKSLEYKYALKIFSKRVTGVVSMDYWCYQLRRKWFKENMFVLKPGQNIFFC